MSYRSIFPGRSKNLIISETNIIDSRIMSYQLSLNALSIDIPYGTSRINTTCSNHGWILRIPIKWCNRCTIIRINISKNLMFFVSVGFFLYFPYSQILSCRRKNILLASFNIGNPHYFGGRKLMFELVYFSESFIRLLEVEINDIYLIVHWICVVTRDRHLKLIIFSIPKSYWVILKATVVCVYLFCLPFFWQMVNFVH